MGKIVSINKNKKHEFRLATTIKCVGTFRCGTMLNSKTYMRIGITCGMRFVKIKVDNKWKEVGQNCPSCGCDVRKTK